MNYHVESNILNSFNSATVFILLPSHHNPVYAGCFWFVVIRIELLIGTGGGGGGVVQDETYVYTSHWLTWPHQPQFQTPKESRPEVGSRTDIQSLAICLIPASILPRSGSDQL